MAVELQSDVTDATIPQRFPRLIIHLLHLAPTTSLSGLAEPEPLSVCAMPWDPAVEISSNVAAMRASPQDVKVQRRCCTALANIAVSPYAKDAVVAAGGPAAVTAAMSRFNDDEVIIFNGLRALANAAHDSPQGQRAVAAAGGATAVQNALGKENSGDMLAALKGNRPPSRCKAPMR